MKVSRFLGVLLMVTMVAVAGCGGGTKNETGKDAAATPAAPQAPAESGNSQPTPKEMVTVKVASGDKGSLLYFPLLVAEQLGYFEQEGIKLDVTQHKGGAQVAQALISGEADFGSTVTDHAPKYKAQGVDLSVVALYTRVPLNALVIDSRHASTIKSVKDLKGRKVGVTSLNSGSFTSLLAMLEKAGLTTKDVEIIGVGFNALEAFKEEKVVAAVTYDPYITQVTEGKIGEILEYDLRTTRDTEKLYGTDFPFGAILTRGDVITSKPAVVQGMVRAIVKANQWIASHSAAEIAVKVPAEYKGNDEALYIKALENSKKGLSPDGVVSTAGMTSVIQSLKALKVIPENVTVNPNDVINMSFVQKS